LATWTLERDTTFAQSDLLVLLWEFLLTKESRQEERIGH
jgi:hypothetical protein